MSCRIGMTTDIESRRRYWLRECPGMKNWQILAGPLNKREAQQAESLLAQEHGCTSYPGGDGEVLDNWYVYGFNCGAGDQKKCCG